MSQAKFIFMMQRVQPASIRDDGNGKVIVILRKGVEISHDYKNCILRMIQRHFYLMKH